MLRNAHNKSASRARRQLLVGEGLERCIFCKSKNIARDGKRHKKFESVQLWYCHVCQRRFTPQLAKGKTYPLKVVLESLMLYYRGETRATVIKRIKERTGIAVPLRTLSSWLSEYRELTTYARLRPQGLTLFRPGRIIRSVRLHHQQVYRYCIHRGKLAAILDEHPHRSHVAVGDYLSEMAEACPHHLFQEGGRASQGTAAFDLDAVEIKAKRNHACRVANLVIQTVVHNRRRHDELQRFMLTTDSVTVAVEVPIYLMPEDISHLKEVAGFDVPLDADETLTGHIDVLQIRNGAIHIIDYKPGANKERPIVQLMVYALALSRRTGLRLYDFVCAWFDEHHYFEFYPLHVVHKKRLPSRGRSRNGR